MKSLNLDFKELAAVDIARTPWQRSAGGHVERRLLERAHAESGHATSIVRYAPGAEFPRHDHPGGEEFLVLDGVFSDEYGDYPAGSYLRNPIGSAHAPFSRPGCTIFVKLCQMPTVGDRVVRTERDRVWAPQGGGIHVATLHVDEHERVDLVRVDGEVRLALADAELLVMEGAVRLSRGTFAAPAWIRIPSGALSEILLIAGTRLWRKRGHLGSISG